MFFKDYWTKITNKNKYQELKNIKQRKKNTDLFKKNFLLKINEIRNKIDNQKELNFLHSGHTADIVNTLPVLKQLSKSHTCNLYINVGKKIDYYHKHPAGSVFLNNKIYNMLKPLLDFQKYINKVDIFRSDLKIDINFDLLREIPINPLYDNVRYASTLTGVNPNYNEPFLDAPHHPTLKNKILIQRTFRYRNDFVSYKFLNDYSDLVFVGTEDEFIDLKKTVKNLIFYNCSSFLEMASAVKSSKFVIANSSLTFPIAEGLDIPRLLESCPYFPAAQPHGLKAFNFYFQNDFEKLFKFLNDKK